MHGLSFHHSLMQALSREVCGVSGELGELFAGFPTTLLHDSADTRLAELMHKLFVIFCTLQLFR